ncbi:non-homologous end joining protein Ku [Pseudoduganella chitinolytica]|uniref:Non-homologous end joining protein Ku n=1 Tax=Pseudoduganella chitinolytica TaxID=34070 RepID=A0ABY8BK39_9BURK|nr:Ku protein [Pseudoduganella chitinolytica]WEF35047.1 Ku protein [Pseudoduganella chitinolytica]
MARALWKGAISFGLVHIPVELHSAVKSNDLDLTMLDKRDFSPIGYKRYNKTTEKEVTWDNIIKGYEYQAGEYVVLSDEDLRQANVKATQTIDILAFVDAEDVPLTYYETPYYLAPGRGGDKVYALLRETLRRAGKIGIATVVIRTKQHLCALVAAEDGIIMNTLRYADEIRDTEDLKLPDKGTKATGIKEKELEMALSLVEGMSEDWAPEQYHDTYKDDVLALVEKKIKARQTKTITLPSKDDEAAPSTNVIDLVALLKQSLGAKPGKGKAAAADDDEEEDQADTDEESDDDEPPPKARRPVPRGTTSVNARGGTSTRAAGKSTATAKSKASPAKAEASKSVAKKAAAKPAAKKTAAKPASTSTRRRAA